MLNQKSTQKKQGHSSPKQTMPQSPKLTDQPRRWNEPWSPVFRLPTIESHSSCRCRGQASRRPRSCPYGTQRRFDFLPCLKAGDSYTVRLNEGLRFGGFPLHWRLRCNRLAPVSVLRRLHGRLTTPRVPRRRGCSVRRSNHGRAVCRIAGIPIRVCPTVSCHPCVRIGSRFGCWDTSGLSGRWFCRIGYPIAVYGR